MISRIYRFFTPRGWLVICLSLTFAAFVGTCMGLQEARNNDIYMEGYE